MSRRPQQSHRAGAVQSLPLLHNWLVFRFFTTNRLSWEPVISPPVGSAEPPTSSQPGQRVCSCLQHFHKTKVQKNGGGHPKRWSQSTSLGVIGDDMSGLSHPRR